MTNTIKKKSRKFIGIFLGVLVLTSSALGAFVSFCAFFFLISTGYLSHAFLAFLVFVLFLSFLCYSLDSK